MTDAEPSHPNTVIDHLLDNGPTAVTELPRQVERTEREWGATTFSVDGRSQGRDTGLKSKPEAVAYLFPVHTKQQVASEWVRANNDLIVDPKQVQILVGRGVGYEWKRPFKRALYDGGSDE